MGIDSNRDNDQFSLQPQFAAMGGQADPIPFGEARAMLGDIKGNSDAMNRVLQTVAKVAKSDCPVLINGESGTGKELIARAIHRLSQRVSKKFLAVNVSAIPDNLLESELFGHVKGAFTGAVSRRAGLFEEASGGTMFLDEIGEMPWHLQAKLLRVLQEKQFSPVGSSETKTTNVRIVAATNVNLEQAVADKTFRLDLFYRLNVLPLLIPSLKDRSSDIPILLDFFIGQANRHHHFAEASYFQPEVVEVLKTYPWPGNVRELQNLVERLVVFTSGGKIRLEDLPAEYRHGHLIESHDLQLQKVASQTMTRSEGLKLPTLDQDLPNEGINLTEYIEGLENKLILQALERTGNNKNQAAKLLGLNRTTLVERIKKRKLAPLNSPSREL